jgi:hypothetical protein
MNQDQQKVIYGTIDVTAERIAIGFAEWIGNSYTPYGEHWINVIYHDLNEYTTKDLYDKFIEERTKPTEIISNDKN